MKGIEKIKFSSDPIALNFDCNQLTSLEGIQDAVKTVYNLSIRSNQISDLSPLCTINLTTKLFLSGNPKPISYSPIAEFKYMYYDNYEEYIKDFDVPKKEIVMDIDQFVVKLDKSPVEIKGKDIYVSPRYFLNSLGYRFSQKKDKLVLQKDNK